MRAVRYSLDRAFLFRFLYTFHLIQRYGISENFCGFDTHFKYFGAQVDAQSALRAEQRVDNYIHLSNLLKNNTG
jgi:hypothetical protein